MSSEPSIRANTFEWADPNDAFAVARNLSGLAYLEALRDGDIPRPPMAALINATVTEVEPGIVAFSAEPGEEHLNPLGTIHGGFICTLLDTVAGCAAHTTLPAGVGYISIEIKVNYLRAINPNGGPITAHGTVTKPGSRIVFVDAEARDAQNRLVATASSSLLVLPGRGHNRDAVARATS